jgi:hypothetical protein
MSIGASLVVAVIGYTGPSHTGHIWRTLEVATGIDALTIAANSTSRAAHAETGIIKALSILWIADATGATIYILTGIGYTLNLFIADVAGFALYAATRIGYTRTIDTFFGWLALDIDTGRNTDAFATKSR